MSSDKRITIGNINLKLLMKKSPPYIVIEKNVFDQYYELVHAAPD